VITYVNPAVAVALGAAVLGERITPAVVISFALILIGSVLATRAPRGPAADGPTCDRAHSGGAGRRQAWPREAKCAAPGQAPRTVRDNAFDFPADRLRRPFGSSFNAGS
jgi:hypothetical protein